MGFGTGRAFAVGGYMLCSATLLISNKYTVYMLPAPSFILFAQLFGTAVAVRTAKALGAIECDELELSKARAFSPAAVVFLCTVFLSMKSLQYSNVETIMVFRFSAPLCISVADYLFLGRELPTPRSWACLVALLLGAVGYVKTDGAFQAKGYAFCALWYMVFCLDQVYVKHVTNTVKMKSNWGRVYYSSVLASMPLIFTFASDPTELEAIQNASVRAILALAVSVALGVAMGYFSWMARSLLSATAFAVVGNACKLLTILLNIAIWDKHASPVGIACLLFCLAAAYLYEH